MIKTCKRNFDCLSLYDDNNTHDSYSPNSSYFPTRKRVCNEFNDNMYISEDSLLFSTEEVTIPKIHQTSPKSTTTLNSPTSLRSFSAPLSPFLHQNENLPNNSKHAKVSSSSSPFSPFSSSSSPIFFNSPSCSPINSQNNFNINNNNIININNNNINNNNNNNNNNIINNNINNNEKMEKNYFNLSNEFFDPKNQQNNQQKENKKSEENSLLNRLIDIKLRDNKMRKNLDLIFTVEDIKEIVSRALQERDEELHEEFSSKLSEKLIGLFFFFLFII